LSAAPSEARPISVPETGTPTRHRLRAQRPSVRRAKRTGTGRMLFPEVVQLNTTAGGALSNEAVRRLSLLLQAILQSPEGKQGNLARWTGPGGLAHALFLKSTRKDTFLQVLADGDVIHGFHLFPVPEDEAEFLVGRLSGAESHDDLIDWFTDTRIRIEPEY